MRKLSKNKYYFSLFFLLIALFAYFYFKNKKDISKQNRSHYTLNNFQKKAIKNGDIILRYGYGFVSDNIVRFLDEPYPVSHCGIICKNNDTLQVIHSESSASQQEEGVYVQDFDLFCHQSRPGSIIVLRYKGLSDSETNTILNTAKQYATKNTPFDYRFNASDSTQIFCTELVRNCYLKVIPNDFFVDKSGNINLLQFKNFYQSKEFKIIVNENVQK